MILKKMSLYSEKFNCSKGEKTMSAPLSFYHNWGSMPESMLDSFVREFKSNGVDKLVLVNPILEGFIQNPSSFRIWLRLKQQFGIDFQDAHMPFGEHMDLACPDRGRRAKMIEEQKQALAYATDLGCKTATIHVGAFESVIFQTPNSVIRPLVVDALEKLIPEAEKLGIMLAIENSFERSNAPDEILYYISQFDSPCFGVCFDSGHANLMEYYPGKEYDRYFGGVTHAWLDKMEYCNDALDKLLPHIVTCHLHDNDGYIDSHMMPGDGITDWDKVMSKLATAPRLMTMQTEVGMFKYGYSVRQLVETFRKIVK